MPSDPFVDAVTALESEFPGYILESLHTGVGWGSRDRNDQWKADVGAWRSRYGDTISWIATVIEEGWEYESMRHIQSADSPALAIEGIIAELRHRRDDPHYAHINDKDLLAECEQCLEDADRLDIPRAELPMVLG